MGEPAKVMMPPPASIEPKVRRWMGICVDGLPFLGIALLLAWIGFRVTGPWLGLPLMVVAGWVAWFFRDPLREIPPDPKAIISPADGTILDIRRVPYPRLLTGEATRVSIFMSVFNVHVNRLPASGVVRKVEYNPGKFLKAYVDKASLDNEQMAILVDTDAGVPILFVQIAGMIARRIICRLVPGEVVKKGEKFGLIRFGSRADVYFPDSCKVVVEQGQKVQGGSTVLAKFS